MIFICLSVLLVIRVLARLKGTLVRAVEVVLVMTGDKNIDPDGR